MKEKIEKLIKFYERRFGSRDPFEIADCLKLKVFYTPLGNIAGYYKYMKHNRCIYINSDIEDDIFRRVVMAHELGHAVLHMKDNCTFMKGHTLLLTSRTEKQANLFAAHLLITDELIHDFHGFTVEQLSDCTGYPVELIKLKLT